jgi:hypothetical protein
MEISLTTPAILFPAVSLLLLAYTNRFLAIASIVRTLVGRVDIQQDANAVQQIMNLRLRISLIKTMQALGIASLFICVLSMLLLYIGQAFAGELMFAASLLLMLASLGFSFWEIMLSGVALKTELKRVFDAPKPVAKDQSPR